MAASAASALLAGGCNLVLGLDPVQQRTEDAAVHDAETDAVAPDAMLGAWNTATTIVVGATTLFEDDPTLSTDGLELYFSRASSATPKNIAVARRNSTGDAWMAAVDVLNINTAAAEGNPRLTADGLTLFLSSDRVGGAGAEDIYRTTRTTLTNAWNTPTLLLVPPINSIAADRTATPCLGEDRLILSSTRAAGNSDLYEVVGDVVTAIPVASTAAAELSPFITEDCRTLYFASDDAGSFDLYVTKRPTVDADWAPPVRIEELTTAESESDPWVSRDGRHLIFTVGDGADSDLAEAFR